MVIFKCKMCGGSLEVTEDMIVCECEYCGTRQTLPKLDSERRNQLFDRANYFRMNNEFDKASQVYENIISESPDEAEAYWGLCLCRYGIEYVVDPKSQKRIPTCHRTQFKSIFDDADYIKAINCCDPVALNIYNAEAEYINGVQKKILEISNREEPFDVFICYKETDASGNRTVDSVIAQDIYENLTEKGYKVFFSRITLEDKLGSAYEPYIFAALNSSKIMLVIGTKIEHFNAVWVKNEWSRYLAMIESGQKKHIIPCYRDMSPYDMPEQFSSLQAQDVSKLGYMQDLLRGLAKIMNEAHSESAHTQSSTPSEQNKVQNIIKLAFLDYENNNISNAQSLFREALQLNSECLEAYFGLILSVEQNGSYVKTLMQLSPEPSNFEKRYIADNYEKCFHIFAESSFISRLKYLLSIHPEMLTKNYKLTDSQYADTESCPITNYVILELNNAVILRNILEVGADPNSERIKKNKGVIEKRSALDDAICCAKNAEMVGLLLKYKADPNKITEDYYDEYDCPPVKVPILSRAVCDPEHYNDRSEIIRLLLENGANPNTCRVYIDEFNKPQYYSVLSDSICNAKNLDVLKLLLKHGADPNKITIENDETDYPLSIPPLNQAIYQNNYEMVKALLENGADPNGCRKFRNRDIDVAYSALGEAIWKAKNVRIVHLLLENGAKADRVESCYDDKGNFARKSMISYAITDMGNGLRGSNQIEVVKMLISYGATWNNQVGFGRKMEIERKYPYPKYWYIDESLKKELKKLGWVGKFYVNL